MAISTEVLSEDYNTVLMTFGGEARSGKGTSVSHLANALVETGQEVRVIDQGLKFRALAEVALQQRTSLDDDASVTTFLSSEKTETRMLALLDEVSQMDKPAIDALLYPPLVSDASRKIGKNAGSHAIAIDLLTSEVQQAVANRTQTILVDGRAMAKYGKRFEDEKLVRYTCDWYFRCDSAIAARRSLGMFVDHENMTADQKTHLLVEVIRISERNRSDALRSTDPMREPIGAYSLHLDQYSVPGADAPQKRVQDILRRGAVVVDTSYTRGVEEMTRPVTELSMLALKSREEHVA